MKRSLVSTVLIIIGLALAAYPKGGELYTAYQQQKLLSQWQQSLAVIDRGDPDTAVGDILIGADSGAEAAEPAAEQERREQEQKLRDSLQKHLEGILTIEKIGLSLPILKGATAENLNTSVASLENSGRPGTVGNYALAAHRSHTYGQLFNRLDELEAGDRIEVDTGKDIYRYTVITKLYVKPEETWVLDSREEGGEITLITCHPMLNPTQRLIVKGKLIEPVKRDSSDSNNS
ncbi:MAG TPA: class D sortase [Desulfitobacterium dehalogenans]|uniref:Class D sortase n=1 Tax=Desulfitobacterium dehalogenans TaxID=36854 RepID=A0A7C6Z4E5_9FIRM|nr:class D sortase [Desulfitobacterium dehalogenans]